MNPISRVSVPPGTPVESGAPLVPGQPASELAARQPQVQTGQTPRAEEQAGSNTANPRPGTAPLAFGQLPPEIPAKISTFLHYKDMAAFVATGKEVDGAVKNFTTDEALRKVHEAQQRVRESAAPADVPHPELTAAISNAKTDQSLRMFKGANQRYLFDLGRELEAALQAGNFHEGGAAALFLSLIGRNDEAERVARWALNQSGANSSRMPLARVLLRAGRFAEARQEFEHGPRIAYTNSEIRLSRVLNGDFAGGLNNHEFPRPCCATAMARHSLGQVDEALDIARTLPPWEGAVFDAWQGNAEGMLRKLTKFIRVDGTEPTAVISVNESIAKLRLTPIAGDPRFLNFLESVYMAPAQLATIPFEIPDSIPGL